MPALIQFVDSIASSPTVRLDINDASVWFTRNFSAPPPRLRRSMSQNAMRDGAHVSSSSYDTRTLSIELTLIKEASEDLAATEMQKLWRELDRADNFLRYQPDNFTKPVFFRLYRSDVEDLEELWTVPIARTITLELLAEPFALGLKEVLGPYTVNNNPAAGSNGLFVTLGSVVGDVAAPAVIQLAHGSSTLTSLYLAVRNDSAATDLIWQQAEAMTLGTDTTNPGSGPDAAMSGSGTNNFRRTSFATATMQTRLTPTINVLRGTYRLLACVRRSDATSVMTARVVSNGIGGPTTTIPLTTARQVLDLGVFSYSRGDLDKVGYSSVGSSASVSPGTVAFQAARASGSGTLDWDFVLFLPADVCTAAASGIATAGLLVDGIIEAAIPYAPGGDPFAGTATPNGAGWALSGGFPFLVPNDDNRLTLLHSRSTGHTVGDSVTLNAHYWPRYLYVRPVST